MLTCWNSVTSNETKWLNCSISSSNLLLVTILILHEIISYMHFRGTDLPVTDHEDTGELEV
jgi:hypothetical protein